MAEKEAKTDGFPNRIDMRLQRGRCLLLLQMRCSPTLDGIYSYFRRGVVLLRVESDKFRHESSEFTLSNISYTDYQLYPYGTKMFPQFE